MEETVLSPRGLTEFNTTQGQFNLFTGEVGPVDGGVPRKEPEERWLFDPDFRLGLPEDRAGKEILIEEGIALSLPAGVIGDRLQGTGYRGQVTGNRGSNRKSKIPNRKSHWLPANLRAALIETSPPARGAGPAEACAYARRDAGRR